MKQFIRLTKDINILDPKRGLLKGNVFKAVQEGQSIGVYVRDWKDKLTRIYIAEFEIIEDSRCNNCGKPGTIFDTCPFLAEIHPESDNPEEFWCDDCYQESLDTI